MKKSHRKLCGKTRLVTSAPTGAMAFIPVMRGANKLEVRAEGETAEILLIGSVGKSWWDDSGITEKEFRDALDSIPKGKPITVSVNSEGGAVQEGLGIYNAIKDRRSDITAKITGYALSIASVFPLAAGKVISPKSAIWMMHKAWSWNQGNADDMRQAADMLDAHDETLVDVYAAETGKSKADIRAAMEAETWVKGADAVAWGLADETDPEETAETAETAAAAYRPLARDFLSRCKNISPEILNCLSAPANGHTPTTAATPPAITAGAEKNSAAQNGGQQTKPQPPQENIMNKKLIVALLFEHGIKAAAGKDFTEQSTDAELEAALKTLAKKDGLAADARMKAIELRLAQAEERRVTDKVLTYVSAGKITNDEAPIFVKAALNDEAGTLAILDKKEAALENGAPISGGFSHAEAGAPQREPAAKAIMRFEPVRAIIDANKGDRKAQHKALMADWDAIYAEACKRDNRRGGPGVMNANSISNFTTAFLLQGSLTPLQNKWAPLMAFSKDYSPDPYKPLATPTLKNPTAASATLTDATTFNSGNSTVGALTATMHQYTQPYQISNTDLNSGLRMEDLFTINIAAFANKVIDVALAPVTAANFTATPVIQAAAAFGFSDLAYLQGQLQKSDIQNLILDGSYLASISNTPAFFQSAGTVGGATNAWSAFGWEMIVRNSRWNGAGNNIKGLACNPQAIVGIMGLPLTPAIQNGGIFNVETFQVPGLNISVAIYTWWDVNARTLWTSYDVVAGFALGDATAGILVASGTPS